MDNKAAKRYARALFDTAQKLNVVESVEDDLTAIAGIIENDPSFADFLFSPRVAREEKLRILDRLFSDRVTALTMQAIRLMLEKRREREISGVQTEFVSLRRSEGGVMFATVTTAEALDDSQKAALKSKLERESGKKVESEFRVDPALIGGIRVAYGNFVLDGSVRGGLSRLRDSLKRDLLKQV